jgi:hypothetical protein
LTYGGLKTRDYYLACRYDKGILESLIDTAKYKSVPISEVCQTLGIELSEEQIVKLNNMGYRV